MNNSQQTSGEEPKERTYPFKFKDPQTGETYTEHILESELTQEQVKYMVGAMSHFFNSMPGIVQDQFIEQLEESVNETLHQYQTAMRAKSSVDRILDPNGNPIIFSKPGEA